MPYLLRIGKGKGLALYTRCEDELLAKAELLLLKETYEKDEKWAGKPIYGFLDVDPNYTISRFKGSYRGDHVQYKRLLELRQLIISEGWNYPKVDVAGEQK